jgi:hypothetical protein
MREGETEMATAMTAPVISENLWGDEEVQAYYTVRCYNASGIGVTHEMFNVYAKSEAEAKEVMQLQYRIARGLLYCLYAFKQDGRV